MYETKPFAGLKQGNYLNAVIKVSTRFKPDELFGFLKNIEKELGRTRTEKWGSREIDLDILFYNEIVYSDKKITIPHKGVIKRDFVLIPLKEIDPELIHPELNQKICDITIPDSAKCVIRKLTEKLLTGPEF